MKTWMEKQINGLQDTPTYKNGAFAPQVRTSQRPAHEFVKHTPRLLRGVRVSYQDSSGKKEPLTFWI